MPFQNYPFHTHPPYMPAGTTCLVPTGYLCGSVSSGSPTVTCASSSCGDGYHGSPITGGGITCTMGTGSWSLFGCSGRQHFGLLK